VKLHVVVAELNEIRERDGAAAPKKKKSYGERGTGELH